MPKDIKSMGGDLLNAPRTFVTVTSEVGETVTAQINPKEISFNKSVDWGETNAAGRDFPDLQWKSGKSITLSLELLFDKYETDGDVRDETDILLSFAMRRESLHRPPKVKIAYGGPLFGGYDFEGVVTSVKVRYTMFNGSGQPVRAIATIDVRQGDKAMVSGDSPDVAKQRIVKRGETLQLIAESEYRDASQWRRIADVNNIDDPLVLEPGTRLIVPPIL